MNISAQSPKPVVASLDMMTWNVKAGGFDDYGTGAAEPEREAAIKDAVDAQHKRGVSAVAISDAYRWGTQYPDAADSTEVGSGLAKHLGFKHAWFVDLEDERLKQKEGAEIGVAFASDHTIESRDILDLDTRQGMRVILAVGHYGLQIANVYLDDMSEDVRKRHFAAFQRQLEDMPTIITGDLNCLRSYYGLASEGVLYRNMAAKLLARVLPKEGGFAQRHAPAALRAKTDRMAEIGTVMADMNRREALPEFLRNGWIDADRQKARPTSPASQPLLGLDYALHNRGVDISNFMVAPNSGASDHRAITYTVDLLQRTNT